MRELTPQELAFIDDRLDKYETEEEIEEKQVKNKKNKKAKVRRKLNPFFSLTNWGVGLMIIPIIFTMLFLSMMNQVEQALSVETLKMFKDQALAPEAREQLENSSYSWILSVSEIYANRGIIIGGVFTFFIILMVILISIDVLIVKRRQEVIEDD